MIRVSFSSNCRHATQSHSLSVKRCLDDVKRHDEETRRARIQYAEKLLQRLKAGPKQLDSAYKLCTILGEQERQRHERHEQEQLE